MIYFSSKGMAVHDPTSRVATSGRVLMEEAVDIGDNGFILKWLELNASVSNVRAIHIYKKFEVESTLRASIFRECKYVDI